MTLAQKLALGGAVLGTLAALYMLSVAYGGSLGVEGFIPGLLTMAFSAIACWGCFQIPHAPKRSLRPLLGALAGGLISAGLFYAPAALALAAAAGLAWQSSK